MKFISYSNIDAKVAEQQNKSRQDSNSPVSKYSPGSLQSPGLLSGHHGNNNILRSLNHGPGSGGLPGIDALSLANNLEEGKIFKNSKNDEDVEMK